MNYQIGNNAEKPYGGAIYIKDKEGLTNIYVETYGIKDEAYNKEIFIPIQNFGIKNAADLVNLKIKITNTYDTYASRFIYFYKVNYAQNQGIIRGLKNGHITSIEFTYAGPGVKITKTVAKVDDVSVVANTKAYVEKGCKVTYNISLTCIGTGSIKGVKFTDNAPEGLSYVTSTVVTKDDANSNTFTYTEEISASKPVTATITYIVTADHNNFFNKMITNTVEVTQVCNIYNAVVYEKNKVNYLYTGSVLTSSALVYMKRYDVSITKTADKEVAEYGDRIQFNIVVKNTGTTPEYGSFNNIIVEDALPNGIEYSYYSGRGWTKDNNNYKYSQTLNPGDTTTLTITGYVNDTGKTVTNTAKITQMLNHNGEDVTINKSSSCKIKLKMYKAEINKYITIYKNANNTDTYPYRSSLDEIQKRSNPINLEVGDTVTYKVDFNSLKNDDYGQVRTFDIKDEFDEGLELTNIILTTQYGNKLEWGAGIQESQIGTTMQFGTVGLQVLSKNSFELKGLTILSYPYMTLNFTVVHRSKTEDILKNTASIEAITNNNGELPLDKSVGNKSSTEYIKTKTYGVSITKTVTKVISSSNNKTTSYSRETLNNTQKNNNPVEVEKGDKVEYVIKIKNIKNTTLYNFKIDDLYEGIGFNSNEVTMTVNGQNINQSFDSYGGYRAGDISKQTRIFGWSYRNKNIPNGGLKPNAQLEIKIKATVTASNMTLLNCLNQIDMVRVENKNGIVIKDEGDKTLTDILNDSKDKNKEYIRLKNLIISGTVWQDNDKDGVMENGEPKLQGIEVELHDDTNKKVATTYTDKNGKYVFGETNGKNQNGSTASKKMVEGGDNSGRVIKATNRDDSTGNYTNQSKYINYYVKFRYNGVDYKSSVYSGKDNIIENNNFTTKYKTDSNAMEYEDEREAFNKNLSIIGYNKSINPDQPMQVNKLEFEKNRHISDLKLNDTIKMNAYSFVIKGTKGLTGLSNGNNIDMLFFNVTDSEAETEYLKYINLGLEQREELDLKVTKDLVFSNVSINGHSLDYDFAQVKDNDLYYRTGANGEESYKLEIYKSDYYYRYEMYENQEVKNAKGKESELEILFKYKITIMNQSKGNTFAKVRELVDYYSDKIQISPGMYMEKDGVKYSALSTAGTSEYNNEDHNFSKEGYQTIFIRGMDSVLLKTNEKLEIYIPFIVKKDTNRAVALGDITNIAQISTYATYTDEKCDKSAGLVDKDSNAANINKNSDAVKIDQKDLYEDNTFRIKTNLGLKGENNPTVPENPTTKHERRITGSVFEDARSLLVSESSENAKKINQFVGNGEYNSADKRHPGLQELFKENISKEQDSNKDKKLEGMTVELIEVIKGRDGKLYEETLDYKGINGENFANVMVQTDKDGKYTLEAFVPGTYIIRFRYGDIYLDKTMSANTLLHNGQDYKSTTYTLKNKEGNILEDSADNETKYAELIKPNKSDAIDNEYRRIEIMAESETMKSDIAETMKYTNYNSENLDDSLREFSKKTNCFADTVQLDIGIESPEEIQKRNGTGLRDMLEEYIPYKENINSLEVPNIDFGLVYRPENFIELEKKIKSIELKTSVGNTLVKIEYDENGNVVGVPQGIDKVQSINSVRNVQGFRYINVDEDIMQGSRIAIEYYMKVKNIGEVDTVSRELATSTATAIKDTLKEDNIVYIRMNQKIPKGKYLGAIYYKGIDVTRAEVDNLAIVPVTIRRIVDWVDNDATFESKNNNEKDKYWIATTEGELLDKGLIAKNSLYQEDELYYKDEYGRKYTTEKKKNIVVSANTESENEALITPIYPEYARLYALKTEAKISIEINGILGAGTDENNMTYENVAEVVEYTTLVGRRTNLSSTVGNIRMTEENSTPYIEAYEESDSSGTETVNLIPPTGLVRYKLFIASNGVLILTILIAILVITEGAIICKKVIFKKKIYK